MKISKLIPVSHVISSVLSCGGASGVEKRCSGDTLGEAIEVIGKLMQTDTPYHVCVCGNTPNRQRDRMLLEEVDSIIHKLGLKHFEISFKDLTVTYDIWYKV